MKVATNDSMMAILNKHLGSKLDELKDEPKEQAIAQNNTKSRDDSVSLENSKKVDAQVFSINAQNSNEAIGLLQTAKKTIGKMEGYKENLEWIAQIKNDGSLGESETKELTNEAGRMASEIRSMFDNASFMGKKVFGTTVSIDFGAQKVNFDLNAPKIPQNISEENVASMYQESGKTLNLINGAISDIVGSLNTAQSKFDNGGHDFSAFQKDVFKNMF